MEHILSKIRIGVGESTSHIIIFSAAGLDQLLESRNYTVIAAVACVIDTQAVMDLFSAVKAQDYIAHFTVGKIYHIVVDEHAVGGQRKAEIFVTRAFLLPGIVYQFLDHLPVHQGLSAEKVNFQVGPAAGVIHEKIKSLLSDIERHKRPVAVVFSLACKAVGAVQVTGMGYM